MSQEVEKVDKRIYKFRLKESSPDLSVHLLGFVDTAEEIPFFNGNYCQVSYPMIVKDFNFISYPEIHAIEGVEGQAYYRMIEVLFGDSYNSFCSDSPYLYLKESEFSFFGIPSSLEVKMYNEILKEQLTERSESIPELDHNIILFPR